ncbi:MAG: helix-turn-helix transcriptional regulator [Promethearchaeota archaeon]
MSKSRNISDLKIKNLTKLYILVILKSKSKVTGYYILKKLEKDLGKIASPTYVYDFLKNLKKEGYIKDAPNPSSKKKVGYTLTSEGDILIDKIFSRFNNLIEVAVQSKLKICAGCGVQLYEKFQTETIDGKEMNFCCKHCLNAFKEHQNI